MQADTEKKRALSVKEAAELGRLRRKIKILEEVCLAGMVPRMNEWKNE